MGWGVGGKVRGGERREREIISEKENMYISGVGCSSFQRLGLAMALYMKQLFFLSKKKMCH